MGEADVMSVNHQNTLCPNTIAVMFQLAPRHEEVCWRGSIVSHVLILSLRFM
jgi:hypothetical protein